MDFEGRKEYIGILHTYARKLTVRCSLFGQSCKETKPCHVFIWIVTPCRIPIKKQ